MNFNVVPHTPSPFAFVIQSEGQRPLRLEKNNEQTYIHLCAFGPPWGHSSDRRTAGGLRARTTEPICADRGCAGKRTPTIRSSETSGTAHQTASANE